MQESKKTRAELIQEIADLRQQVVEARLEKEKFQSIIEQSDDGIVIMDDQGRVVEWNWGQEQITGIKRIEVIGQPLWDAQYAIALEEQKSPAAHQMVKIRILDVLETRQANWFHKTMEREIQRPDGTRRVIQSVAFPIESETSFMVGSISRDVTESKSAGDEMRRYNERLKILYDIAQANLANCPVNDLAQMAIDRLRNLIECQQAYIVDFDFESNSETILATLDEQLTDRKRHFLDLNSLSKDLRQGKLHIVEEISPDTTLPPERILYEAGIRAYVSFPLMAQENVVGTLTVGKAKAGPFSEETLAIIREVGDSLAIALQQAWLRDAVQIYTEFLENSLQEKEVLLKEIHHRVKNNLQVISSLLSLQASHIKDRQVAQMFLENQSRIRSMALIHEKLYRSPKLTGVHLASYINHLANDLLRSYQAHARNIRLVLNVANINLDIDTAIPIGLIINELISNALKHAFTDKPQGKITIKTRTCDDASLVLTVTDDGGGFPADIDFRDTETLGLQLVTTLVRQLDGTIELAKNNGTTFKIVLRMNSY